MLEVNASSRRNGKTVLSHLQEATQSHSLHNASGTAASGGGIGKFFGSAKPTPTAKPEEPKGTQGSLSLVLFEDVSTLSDLLVVSPGLRKYNYNFRLGRYRVRSGG